MLKYLNHFEILLVWNVYSKHFQPSLITLTAISVGRVQITHAWFHLFFRSPFHLKQTFESMHIGSNCLHTKRIHPTTNENGPLYKSQNRRQEIPNKVFAGDSVGCGSVGAWTRAGWRATRSRDTPVPGHLCVGLSVGVCGGECRNGWQAANGRWRNLQLAPQAQQRCTGRGLRGA